METGKLSLEDFKSHFYTGHEFIHLNNSGQSLIPDLNRDLAYHWLQKFYQEGASCSLQGWEQTEVTRRKLARFIGADPTEVSFFQTTASALSQVALGLKLHSSDEILIWDQEYPTNFYPWSLAAQKNSAKLIQVESENWQTPVKSILNKVTEKTRVIAVSWVQYQTGAVTDLHELSSALKGRNIWLVADVIQGVGVRPLNFHQSGFDIICGGSHKWLCSSYGAAYMAIKKERIPELAPYEVGAMTFGNPDTPKNAANLPKADSSRYEPGSKAMVEVIAMQASLDLLQSCGIENIFNESVRLAELLAKALKDRYQVFANGPIVNLAPENAEELIATMKKLDDAKVTFAKRGPGVRLSVHAYNRDSEIERVINLLLK